MTSDALHSYAYDAENRITTVDSTAATYSYSGPFRVKKVVGATTTVYVFSGSKVIAEYVNGSLSKEYVYAGGRLLTTIAADGTTTYQHPDHLSTRAETDASGNPTRGFGHYPFGETWYETGTASKWKFTSYERDDESGLDQAIFRYDSSRLGRFMSPDPLSGSVFDPQSLDRYSYVRNDPVDGVDPLGLNDHVKQNATGSWDWWARGGCSLGGTATPCSMVYSVLSAGAGYVCPNNDCSFLRVIGDTFYRLDEPLPGGTIKMNCTGPWSDPTRICVVVSWQSAGKVGDEPWADHFMNTPWTFTAIGSTPEEPLGPAFTVSYIPRTMTLCVGGGVGVAEGRNVSFGPVPTSNPQGLVQGGTVNVGYIWPSLYGVQVVVSPGNTAAGAGPAYGIPGASGSATYSGCGGLPF